MKLSTTDTTSIREDEEEIIGTRTLCMTDGLTTTALERDRNATMTHTQNTQSVAEEQNATTRSEIGSIWYVYQSYLYPVYILSVSIVSIYINLYQYTSIYTMCIICLYMYMSFLCFCRYFN